MSSEPGLDVEFVQVLQDMIGDLTGAPEPVVVKLFSQDPDLLATWAPQVADALEKTTVNGKTPIVDVENGIEKTTSGPAVRFTVNPEAADMWGWFSRLSQTGVRYHFRARLRRAAQRMPVLPPLSAGPRAPCEHRWPCASTLLCRCGPPR